METSAVDSIRHRLDAAAKAIAEPGDWLTGQQRIDAWAEVRKSRHDPLDQARRQALTPAGVLGEHESIGSLSATMADVVHRVASDPGRLTRAWADEAMARVGEETYTELVGVTAITTTCETAERALGVPTGELPKAIDGEPTRVRPDGVGDIGAWVSQTVAKTRANVSRTLSLVPVTDSTWRGLVNDLYSRGDQFFDLAWDRDLSRPQVELLAARTTVLSQCFY